MRLAIVSDIHGNLPALEAVLADASTLGVDTIVNLGDIASGPLWPAETVARLRPLALPTLRGNHERQLGGDRSRMGAADAFAAAGLDPAQRAWLQSLPTSLRLADGVVYACHGTPTSDLDYLLETVEPGHRRGGPPGIRAATAAELADRLPDVPAGAQVVLCGHTHVPRVAWDAGRLLLNPGSVGLPAYDDGRPHPHAVEAGSPHARWALLERAGAGWHARLCATPYDWGAAARRAAANGRGDWADALLTGRVGRTEAEALAEAQAEGRCR
jgi:predicted phosphodiesterase